jgi:hypothetical protein
MPTHQKTTTRSATSMQMRTRIVFLFKFGIFGSFFATTWFVFANQTISKSTTLVEA